MVTVASHAPASFCEIGCNRRCRCNDLLSELGIVLANDHHDISQTLNDLNRHLEGDERPSRFGSVIEFLGSHAHFGASGVTAPQLPTPKACLLGWRAGCAAP